MLLRRHIQKLLSEYYSQPSHKLIGSAITPGNSIPFSSLLGKYHWHYIHKKSYINQTGQWLTPTELFQPYYSNIIANFIAHEVLRNDADDGDGCDKEKNRHNEKIQVLELGGGRGTNAYHILKHLERAHPDVYERIEYHIVDSSETLLHLQKNILSEAPKDVNFVQMDMLDVAEDRASFLTKSNTHTIVLAMELLDNLPHDKIIKTETGDILQTEIHFQTTLEEKFLPLSDPLLKQIITLQPSYVPLNFTNAKPRWIPTVACGLLRNIFNQCPNSSVIFADFDWLPRPTLDFGSVRDRKSTEGLGEPLVTDMDDVDHECYLSSPNLCDVLFPTDFNLLAEFAGTLLQEKSKKEKGKERGLYPWVVCARKQSEFLLEYGKKELEGTRSYWTGYTPLLEDFSNCSVLTISRHGNSK